MTETIYYLVKKCSKCGEEKTLDCFHKDKQNRDGLKGPCKTCTNKNALKWQKQNKEAANKIRMRWKSKNRQKCREMDLKWRQENREHLRKYRRDRYHNDTAYKMSIVIRGFVRRTVEGRKSQKTFEMIGYTPEELIERIECQFVPGMAWSNYGSDWHIDHRLSVDYMLKKGETRPWIVNALSNLKPMWAEDNHSKNNKTELYFQG